MEMNKMEKMEKIWKILMDTRLEIIKAKFRDSEYAETYALNYNQAYQQYGVYGLQAQILYVQSNLGYWRGEKARAVKLQLKKAAKMLESL